MKRDDFPSNRVALNLRSIVTFDTTESDLEPRGVEL
jgi:hypothetical protein